MAQKYHLQEVFLNHIRKNKIPTTVFLTNGVKLQGIVTWFDHYTILLKREGFTQLVFKHAISTVVPAAPINLRGDITDDMDIDMSDVEL
jgi:host factor-I protein